MINSYLTNQAQWVELTILLMIPNHSITLKTEIDTVVNLKEWKEIYNSIMLITLNNNSNLNLLFLRKALFQHCLSTPKNWTSTFQTRVLCSQLSKVQLNKENNLTLGNLPYFKIQSNQQYRIKFLLLVYQRVNRIAKMHKVKIAMPQKCQSDIRK